jgi:hypothetical protein
MRNRLVCVLLLANLLLTGLLLAGCGTTYKDMSPSGGVAALQMSADTWRIEARGNGFTNANLVKDYMLLKAAETTKQSGGTHFIIIEQADASTKSTHYAPGSRRTTLIGATRYSTYTPATATRVFHPGRDAYIRVVNVAAGQAAPEDAQSADEIIKFVGGRIQRG